MLLLVYVCFVRGIGSYCIEVIYDCTAVPCSPLVIKAYDASAIKCGPIPLGFVDKPVEFNGICHYVLTTN